MVHQVDVVVLGAGASGLMLAAEAGKRGRSVVVLEKANKVGKKILMSGGGKCNFTNLEKFTGHVEQISPAAGSEFSVLKPDNATGNFTKVVQRISVRIAIEPNQKGIENLRPGMSVITSVDTDS